jgi:hypothetical protein
MAKIDQEPIFIGHEDHIPARLSIKVLYTNFYAFCEISNFVSLSKRVNLKFTQKSFFNPTENVCSWHLEYK